MGQDTHDRQDTSKVVYEHLEVWLREQMQGWMQDCSASITFPLQRQLEFPIGSLSSGTQSPGDSPGAVTAPDPPS